MKVIIFKINYLFIRFIFIFDYLSIIIYWMIYILYFIKTFKIMLSGSLFLNILAWS